MPAAGAHYKFAQLALDASPADVRDAILANQDMFNLGAQGPDLLFFYRPIVKNHVSQLGHQLHTQNGAHLILPLLDSRASWSPALTAYLMGFCCHFSLDRACHPFICHVAPSSRAHQRIEAELDRLIFDQHHITAPRQTMLPKKADIPALQQVYWELSPRQLHESVFSIRLFNHILEHPKHVRFVEKLLGRRGAFSEMCVPDSVPDGSDAHKIPTLFQGAIPVAVHLMGLLISPLTNELSLQSLMKENFEGVSL